MSLFEKCYNHKYYDFLKESIVIVKTKWQTRLKVVTQLHCSKNVWDIGPGAMVYIWIVLSLVWLNEVRSNINWSCYMYIRVTSHADFLFHLSCPSAIQPIAWLQERKNWDHLFSNFSVSTNHLSPPWRQHITDLQELQKRQTARNDCCTYTEFD